MVEGVECVIIATDPTVDGNAVDPYPLEKIRRAARIAAANRLPLVNLVESGGDDRRRAGHRRAAGWPATSAGWPPSGCRRSAWSSAPPAARPPTCRRSSDYTIMVRGHATDAARGAPGGRSGAEARCRRRADQLAEDERDGLRLARQCVRRLNWRKRGPLPRTFPPAPPKYDAEDLLAVAGARRRVDPREVLARILDGSDFDEFKPAQGTALVAGWGELHGYPVGVLAGTGRPAHPGRDAEGGALHPARQRHRHLAAADPLGDPAFGPAEIDALAHSTVPHLALNTGRTGDPRFVFSWPARRARRGGDDDGVIDPRDTRTVLGLCLSAVHSAVVEGAGHVGVFRPGKVDQ